MFEPILLFAKDRRNLFALLLSWFAVFGVQLGGAAQSAVPRTPIISVPSGALNAPAQVAIASQDCVLTYYTTDGTTPTTNSLLYTGPFTVAYTETIKAMSYENGQQSTVASASYSLDPTMWPAPSVTDHTPPLINLQLPTIAQ